MLANIVFQFFIQGGPIMWPILISAIVAVAVVGERSFWWWRESRKRDPQKMEQLLAALENSDVPAATKIAEGSEDPVIRMIYRGLNHVHTSLQGALQLAAGIELKRAGRFLTVMDTLVTLAPSARFARHGDRLDARVSAHRQRGTVGFRGHRRHRRGVDRDGVRTGHRDFRADSVQLFFRETDAVAIRFGNGGDQC